MHTKTLIKKIYFLVFFVVLAAGCSSKTAAPSPTTVQTTDGNYTHDLQVGSQILKVEIADTPAKQELGLSGRSSMADNEGMLFEFPIIESPAFWMKDMNFNLDFIWIAGGKIVGITPDVSAPVKIKELKINDSNLPLYYPPSPVNAELEVNAGWAKKNNIAVGDVVKLLK